MHLWEGPHSFSKKAASNMAKSNRLEDGVSAVTGLVGRGGSAVSWVPAPTTLHVSSFQPEWLSGEHWYLAAAAARSRRDLSRCAVPTLGVPRQIGREKHVTPLLPRPGPCPQTDSHEVPSRMRSLERAD